MSYNLGIDVGNTCVAATIATATGVERGNVGGPTVVMPATVHLRDDGTLAVGEAPNGPAASAPDHHCGGLVSKLGDPRLIMLGDQTYTVTDLLATLLRGVVQKVAITRSEPPDHVVLTHPASWGPFRRVLFDEASRRAGLHTALMVTEPEAAATYYNASQEWNDGDTIAVYDLGGETFDATVLLKQSGGAHILGEPERVESLGGNNFDEAILSSVNDTIDDTLRELGATRSPDTVTPARVRQDCIRAKEALSTDVETTFQVLLPNRRFDVRLARSDFENMVREQIKLTIDALSRTLQSAQVEPAQLSTVLLVGGSSRIPLVARMVAANLGCPAVVLSPHPQHVVALGAAMLAAQEAHADTPQRGEPQNDRQNDGRRQNGKRLTGNGTTTSTLTAERMADSAEQRETQPQIPVQRTTGVIPTQRTPPGKAPAAATPPTTGDSGADPVQPLALVVKPRPPQPRPPQPVLHRTGPKSKRPQRGSPAYRAAQQRVVIYVGMTAVLTGSILLALFGGKSGTHAPAQPAVAQPVKPEQTAVTNLPEIAIPAVAATVALDAGPAFVTVSPNGKYAYVAETDAQTVNVLDTADRHVIATIPITTGPPRFLAFAPDGRTLYVSIYNDQRTIHSIDVLDTRSNSEVATIPQPARPYLPAVSPDGKRLFVPNHDVASVSVIDTATNAVIAQVPVAPNPHWVDFTPDGRRAYTANHESNLVSVIDTTTLGVVATTPVGMSPHSVAVNPHRPLAANVNFDSASVSVIDTISQKVVATIPVGQNPQDIAWGPDGRFAYAVNEGSNSVSVIDSTTNRVTTTIPTGAGPTSISLLPNGHQAYVSNLDGKTLTVLDLAH